MKSPNYLKLKNNNTIVCSNVLSWKVFRRQYSETYPETFGLCIYLAHNHCVTVYYETEEERDCVIQLLEVRVNR